MISPKTGDGWKPGMGGNGVWFDSFLKPVYFRRIEMLGKLNDRRLAYLAAGDRESLLRLAAEYEEMKMRHMAREIREEAESL